MAVKGGERAVFVDKDGTLVEDLPYNIDPSCIKFTDGATDGLRLLADRGFRIFVISNQPGVALGRFSEDALTAVERHISDALRGNGVTLEGFYYCPHLPNGAIARYAVACSCRKPASGLLLQAARDHGLELARCWMVGDILDDIEAGRRARCRTILIDNGNETEWDLRGERQPEAVAHDLLAAAQIILASAAGGRAGP